MRARVTAKDWPTSSRVCSEPSSSPKRILITFSSRAVNERSTVAVCSLRLTLITASAGETAMRSSMKSPRCESSSDRKSTCLNSSHLVISYAVFCLKKKSDHLVDLGFRQDAFCQRVHHPWSRLSIRPRFEIFFFNDTATTEIYTLSLHDALPI